MPLRSNLFFESKELQACLTSDPAHVTPGAVGPHVRKIQIALQDIDGVVIDAGEFEAKRYGPSTAAAVLAFKKKRKIINRSYQTTADNIVGKMTIKALDDEILARQKTVLAPPRFSCKRIGTREAK